MIYSAIRRDFTWHEKDSVWICSHLCPNGIIDIHRLDKKYTLEYSYIDKNLWDPLGSFRIAIW